MFVAWGRLGHGYNSMIFFVFCYFDFDILIHGSHLAIGKLTGLPLIKKFLTLDYNLI